MRTVAGLERVLVSLQLRGSHSTVSTIFASTVSTWSIHGRTARPSRVTVRPAAIRGTSDRLFLIDLLR